MTQITGKPKRHRLTNMQYDEISLVDKGANQHAHVVIVKRDGTVSKQRPADKGSTTAAPVGNMPKNRKADYYNSKKARNPNAKDPNWKEERHPRKAAGSPSGGEFDQTSSESKKKYGKGGTTKAKQDAEKKGGTAKHTTKKGDTLWDLAVKHYGDGTMWKKIAKANGIKDPKKLPVGMDLKIPGSKLAGEGKKKAAKASRGASTAKPKYRKVMEPGGRVHMERIPEPKKKTSPPAKKKVARRRRKTSEVKKLALHNLYMNFIERG